MKLVKRTILTLAFASAAAFTMSAERFQCQDPEGCPATITTKGKTRTIHFRKGDLVETNSGWLVDPEEGWSKV